MNANELADDIETQYTENGESLSLIASVLRRQQAEIEALKAELEHMRSFFGCDPAYYGMTYDPKKHGVEE